MSRDPLLAVLRLRQRTVDDARLGLAQAVAAEMAAEALARAAERSMECEAQRAADPDGGDELVEAFAAWLPGARQRAAQARAEQERLSEAVTCRRAELAASRAGLDVIETLLRRKQEAAAAARARQEQRRTTRPALPARSAEGRPAAGSRGRTRGPSGRRSGARLPAGRDGDRRCLAAQYGGLPRTGWGLGVCG